MLLLVSPVAFKIFGEQAIESIFLTGNYGAYKNIGDYFNNSGNPLVHTWSLSVEEQIYIFLPLVMLLFLAKQKNIQTGQKLLLILITFFSLILFIFPSILEPLYDKIEISDYNSLYFYSPFHRVWQFAIGGLGFLLIPNKDLGSDGKRYWANRIFVISLAVLIFGSLPFGTRNGSLVASFISLAVICFSSLATFKSWLTTPLKWLGDRSYSIYLVHMPIIYIATSSPYFYQSYISRILAPLAVVLSVLIGSLTYSQVENRYRINQHCSNSSRSSLQVMSIFLIISLLLSLFMIMGANNGYWGSQKNPDQPAAAWNLDNNCERMSEAKSSPCRYEIPEASKTVLLIGDSHAAQFAQAVVDASKRKHWNSVIWTMASCKFVLHDPMHNMSDTCLERNGAIFKWVNKFRPNLVIISQHNIKKLPQEEMKNTVLLLKKIVPTILVIGNTPIFADKRYMTAPALFQHQYAAPKDILLSKMDTSNTNVSDAFLKDLKDKGVETVNLNFLWCNEKFCNRADSRGWLFFDIGHLSALGAERSISYFTNFLSSP